MMNSKNITKKKSNQELITTNQADIICEKLTDGLTLVEILEKSIYHRRKIGKRFDAFRDTRRQAVSVQLDEVLRILKKKS